MHVLVVQEEKLRPENVRVVGDHLYMFPVEILELPPDKELKFAIELLSGTTPISQAPYKMAPRELSELKDFMLCLVNVTLCL